MPTLFHLMRRVNNRTSGFHSLGLRERLMVRLGTLREVHLTTIYRPVRYASRELLCKERSSLGEVSGSLDIFEPRYLQALINNRICQLIQLEINSSLNAETYKVLSRSTHWEEIMFLISATPLCVICISLDGDAVVPFPEILSKSF
jgi:hypothetical protein